jgi:prepilin-type N-terminal cleavage/methylation domain-containing protein
MNYKKGFTLLEIVIVVAIIGILTGVIIAILSSSRSKGSDAKITAHLKSMIAQSQLFTGANSAVTATTTAPTGVAGGNLFTDSTVINNSLYKFTRALPTGTVVYYAANGVSPLSGGLWAFAASTSTGSFCVDYNGVGIIQTPTVMTAGNASTIYPNLATLYTCN